MRVLFAVAAGVLVGGCAGNRAFTPGQEAGPQGVSVSPALPGPVREVDAAGPDANRRESSRLHRQVLDATEFEALDSLVQRSIELSRLMHAVERSREPSRPDEAPNIWMELRRVVLEIRIAELGPTVEFRARRLAHAWAALVRAARAMRPGEETGWVGYAHASILAARGSTLEALELITEVELELDSAATVLLLKAALQSKMGRVGAAAESAERACRQAPDSWMGWLALAQAAHVSGDPTRATEAIETAFERAPSSPLVASARVTLIAQECLSRPSPTCRSRLAGATEDLKRVIDGLELLPLDRTFVRRQMDATLAEAALVLERTGH